MWKSCKKVNISYVIAVWAPCTLAYRPQRAAAAVRAASPVSGECMPGLVGKSGCSKQNWEKWGLDYKTWPSKWIDGFSINFRIKVKFGSIFIIRVRGFPARDIFSLRALRDGLGQGARVVGAPSPSPSASFLQVLVFVGKTLKIEV